MRFCKNQQGYTIVETMIFLAISGMMFTMAATSISGKQASSQFTQGAQQVNEEMRRVVNDVDNGYYPSTSDFQCIGTPSGPQFNKTQSKEQGANKDCVFTGKVIHFSPGGNTQLYNIFTLASNQFKTGGSTTLETPTTFAEAMPKVVYNSTEGIDMTERDKAYPWSLDLDSAVSITGSVRTPIVGIAIIKSLGSGGGTGLSGSQSVSVIPIRAVDVGINTADNMVTYLNGASVRTYFESSKDLTTRNVICITDGSRYAAITLGDINGQRFSTNMKIDKTAAGAGC